MTTQNVTANYWQAEMARMEQHAKASSAMLQKTMKLLNIIMCNALRARKKEYYDKLRVLMTDGYTLVGKTSFDRVSEIVYEQASLSLDAVAAEPAGIFGTYTAADLQELKTIIDEYRATLGKPRKLTAKQQEKVNVALQGLEGWKGYVPPAEGDPAPPVIPQAPQLTWAEKWEIMKKQQDAKRAVLTKICTLISALKMYALSTKKTGFYEQIKTLDKHTWLLYKKGPFEKACEVVIEQATLALEAMTAMGKLYNTYSAADLQEAKTLLEQYQAIAEQPLRVAPKQQEKIDKALCDLKKWRVGIDQSEL